MQGDRELGRRPAAFGEHRAFAGVIAPIEIAVRALEVGLVEAALVHRPSVVADFEHVKICRHIPCVVRPSAPVQTQTLATHRQTPILEVAVLLEDSLDGRFQVRAAPRGSPLSRRLSTYT